MSPRLLWFGGLWRAASRLSFAQHLFFFVPGWRGYSSLSSFNICIFHPSLYNISWSSASSWTDSLVPLLCLIVAVAFGAVQVAFPLVHWTVAKSTGLRTNGFPRGKWHRLFAQKQLDDRQADARCEKANSLSILFSNEYRSFAVDMLDKFNRIWQNPVNLVQYPAFNDGIMPLHTQGSVRKLHSPTKTNLKSGTLGMMYLRNLRNEMLHCLEEQASPHHATPIYEQSNGCILL